MLVKDCLWARLFYFEQAFLWYISLRRIRRWNWAETKEIEQTLRDTLTSDYL